MAQWAGGEDRGGWRRRIGGILLAIALATAVVQPASAQGSELSDEAERLAAEGLAKILQALDLLMTTIPQYAAPEVMPNGDIIIRRLHPEEEEDLEPDAPEGDADSGTET